MKKKLIYIMAGWILVTGFGACHKDNSAASSSTYPADYTQRLGYAIANNSAFTGYEGVLEQFQALYDTLQNPGPFTVIMLPSSAIYPIDSASERDLLYYSVLRGSYSFRQLPLVTNMPVGTLLGTNIYITKYIAKTGDTVITVNGNPVATPDIAAANGWIQWMTNQGTPAAYQTLGQQLHGDSSLTLFASAVELAGLDSLLNDTSQRLTVFAPENSACTDATTIANTPYMSSFNNILQANPDTLKKFVLNHIINSRLFINDMVLAFQSTNDTVRYPTLSGETIRFYSAAGYYGNTYYFWGNGNTSADPVTLGLQDEALYNGNLQRTMQVLIP